jgi:hypothetical protein
MLINTTYVIFDELNNAAFYKTLDHALFLRREDEWL